MYIVVSDDRSVINTLG